MQSVRLLLLAFAHHCYLLETVAEGKTGKTTGTNSCGYQGKFAIALMWIIFFFFCQCLQGSVRGQLGTACVFTQSSKLVA